MRKVLIIINISKDESMSLSKEISSYLNSKGIETSFLSFDGFSDNAQIKDVDFVVTLGGDGTVLYAARNCVDENIPVFPVNLGEFGFLASVEVSEWKEQIDLYLEGKLPVQNRTMIQAELVRDNAVISTVYALNDVVISAKNTARTVALDIQCNNIHLCNLKSDGVILSTATGSTAYSASAGGPIISPLLDAFVLTPINSFSLSSRPIVLSLDQEISIQLQPCRTKEINMIADGQEGILLLTGDIIKIKKLDKKIQLISCTDEKFYKALRSKLNWTGGPHA